MHSRTSKILWIAGLLGSGVVLLLLFLFKPGEVPIYPVCMFHQLTGLDCPGCGSLRAMHQLLHGNLGEALRYNAFLILSLPLFAWVIFRLVKEQLTGGPALSWRPLWLWVYVTAWLMFGVLRNFPTSIFATLSP